MTTSDLRDLLLRIRDFARACHTFQETSDKMMRAALEDIDLIISRRVDEKKE